MMKNSRNLFLNDFKQFVLEKEEFKKSNFGICIIFENIFQNIYTVDIFERYKIEIEYRFQIFYNIMS